MGLAEEVAAGSNQPPWHKKQWVVDQLGDEGPEFLGLLADPSMSYIAITEALLRRGVQVPSRTVYRWCREARGHVGT